jgi:hypothetical protein
MGSQRRSAPAVTKGALGGALQSYIFYDFSKINTQTKFLQSYTDVAI